MIGYATPQAFRAAIKARCAEIVARDPELSVDEVQRRFAYDRVLARCFSSEDADLWVLKGAGALLARLAGRAGTARTLTCTPPTGRRTPRPRCSRRWRRWPWTRGTTSGFEVTRVRPERLGDEQDRTRAGR